MLIKLKRIHRGTPVVSVAAIALGVLAGQANAGDRNGRQPAETAATTARMPLGGRAAAPAGFLDFCRRTPAQCITPGSAGESLTEIESRATSLYWAGVFGKDVPAVGPAATSRVSRDFRYDWNRVFRDSDGARRAPAIRTAARIEAPMFAGQTFKGRPAALAAGEFGAPAVDASASSAAMDLTISAAAADVVSNPTSAQTNIMSRVMAGLPRAVAVEQPATDDGGADLAVTLDKAGWDRVNSINRGVNRRIRRAADIRAFGVADFWQAPSEAGARGDCEDYVLAKRVALIESGIPAEALSIAIVMTRWGESHAVLLLASDSGEFVLDNLTPWISRWDAVDYDWQERQAPGKVFDWVRMAS